MKKLIAILTAVFLFSLVPVSVTNAVELTKEQKAQYKTQVREKRNIIKQNTVENKKLELKIDANSEELGKVIMMLFSRELPPSEEKISQIEGKQEALLKNANRIASVQRNIKRLKKIASINVNEENYQLAISNFDKIIALQEKEEALLKAFDKTMKEFIELIKSLQYK